MKWNLAELNIAKMMFDPDGLEMEDFNDALDPVNALADSSPGFVWRLESGSTNPEADLVFEDASWIVNLSVWGSLEELTAFIRNETHLSIMRRRREWFESLAEATMVLWWVPEGHIPRVPEAQERLLALRNNGPTSYAFSFADNFPAPSGQS